MFYRRDIVSKPEASFLYNTAVTLPTNHPYSTETTPTAYTGSEGDAMGDLVTYINIRSKWARDWSIKYMQQRLRAEGGLSFLLLLYPPNPLILARCAPVFMYTYCFC